MIGFLVSGPDNDTWMFQGDAQPSRCWSCGFVTDPAWVDPSYTMRAGRRPDVSFTYDGCLVVSDNFRAAAKPFPGAVYARLPSQPGWSTLRATRTVAFDAERYGTTFEDWCDACVRFTAVAGAIPVFLRDPPVPLPDEFLRTDIEFGSGDMRSPLLLVGPGVATALRRARLVGLGLEAIEHDSDEPARRIWHHRAWWHHRPRARGRPS